MTYAKKVNFKDASGERFTVDIELSLRNGLKELSICGSHSGGGGQCQDSIKPANEAQSKLLEMWNKYHLNGMSAGTPEQNKLLDNYRNHVIKGFSGLCKKWLMEYDSQCLFLKIHNKYNVKHPETGKPFTYGHAWYHCPLPDDIETQLDNIIKDIIAGGGNPTNLSLGEQLSIEFFEKTKTDFKVEFVEYGKHFADDKDSRDIYKITLTRGERSFSFRFGQSINCSGRFWKYGNYKRGVSNGRRMKSGNKLTNIYNKPFALGEYHAWDKNKDFKEPSNYDVLACLTKHDPGTLEEFCSEFGYDTDSRKAEKTYQAVLNEYKNLKMLYSHGELEKMQEIQ